MKHVELEKLISQQLFNELKNLFFVFTIITNLGQCQQNRIILNKNNNFCFRFVVKQVLILLVGVQIPSQTESKL